MCVCEIQMGEVKMMMMMKEEEGDMMILRVEEEEVEAAAPFLRKTYQIVDEPLTDHIVSWGQNHNTFVVWRPPEFARDLLPNHFKHNNFSSFVRQLNTYGFKKIVADRWEFSNEYFRKGQKHLLSEIQRRKTPLHHHHHEPPPPPLLGPPQNLFNCKTNSFFPHLPSTKLINSNDVLKSLREDNHRLRKKNFMLLSELTHMKKLYTEIIFFMQTHVKLPFALENHQQRPSDHPHPHPHHEAPLLLKSLDSCNNSSVTINDHEDDHEPCESNVKLFGVSLSRKKRKKIEGEELESRLSFD